VRRHEGIARAVDHLPEAALDFLARNACVLDERIRVTVAPRLPDPGERIARNAQRVDDDVVDTHIGHAEVVEKRERLSSDAKVAADRRSVNSRNALPEVIDVKLRRIAMEHSVILGDEMDAATWSQNAVNLREHPPGVGHCLDEMPAHDEVERCVGKRKSERVTDLELDARSESRGPHSRSGQMRFLEIDAGEAGVGKLLREPRRDFSGPAADVEDFATFERMPLENRFLLRPDRLGLRGEVANHRLVGHLPRLRAAAAHAEILRLTRVMRVRN